MGYSSVHIYIIYYKLNCLRILAVQSYKAKVLITNRKNKITLNIKVLTSFFNSFYTQSYKLGDRRFLMLTNHVQMGAKNLIYIWKKKREEYIKAHYYLSSELSY